MIAHSNSRQRILDRLRSIPIQAEPVAPMDTSRLVHYDDPLAKFTEILTLVGGKVHSIERLSQVGEILGTLPEFNTARQIASLVPDAVQGNFHCPQVDDPHALASLDWAIVRGEFAVAENGAVWVTDAHVRHRAIYFITQHLALVVPADQIVYNLHEAYARTALGASSLGAFISGPSKTADIEQSLVIGAHGPRSLTVFLVG